MNWFSFVFVANTYEYWLEIATYGKKEKEWNLPSDKTLWGFPLNNLVIRDLYHETILFHIAAGTVDDLLLAQVVASWLLRHWHTLACHLLAIHLYQQLTYHHDFSVTKKELNYQLGQQSCSLKWQNNVYWFISDDLNQDIISKCLQISWK